MEKTSMSMLPHSSTVTTDPTEIRRTLTALEEGVYEARVLDARPPRFYGTQVMYLQLPDDMEVGVQRIASVTGQHAGGVYITGNPLNPALLGRGRGNFFPAKNAASDADVISRRLLYIDIDPVRPSGVNANADEVARARERTATVVDWLINELYFPMLLFHGTSGSGGMLLYRIDLPNDVASKAQIRACLLALSEEMSDDHVTIDTGVYNAARSFRIPGTVNAKSPTSQPDRPWRLVSGRWADWDVWDEPMELEVWDEVLHD